MAAVIMSKARPEERLNENSDEEGWSKEPEDIQLKVDLYGVADDELHNEADIGESRNAGPVWNFKETDEVKEIPKTTFAERHSKGAKVQKQEFPTLAQSADMTPPKKQDLRQKPKPEKQVSSNVFEQLAEEEEESKNKPEQKPKKTKKTKWTVVDINAKIATTEAAKEAEDIYTTEEPAFDKTGPRKYGDKGSFDGDRRGKRTSGFGAPGEGAFKRNPDSPTEAPTSFRRNTDFVAETTPPRSSEFRASGGDAFIRRSDIQPSESSQSSRTFVRRDVTSETTPTKDFVRRESQPEESKPAEPKKRFVNSKKTDGPPTRAEARPEGPLKDSWTGEAKPEKPKVNAWATNRLSFENR